MKFHKVKAVLMSHLYILTWRRQILMNRYAYKSIITQNNWLLMGINFFNISSIFVHLFKAINNSYMYKIAHIYLQSIWMNILVTNTMYSSLSRCSAVHYVLLSVMHFLTIHGWKAYYIMNTFRKRLVPFSMILVSSFKVI